MIVVKEHVEIEPGVTLIPSIKCPICGGFYARNDSALVVYLHDEFFYGDADDELSSPVSLRVAMCPSCQYHLQVCDWCRWSRDGGEGRVCGVRPPRALQCTDDDGDPIYVRPVVGLRHTCCEWGAPVFGDLSLLVEACLYTREQQEQAEQRLYDLIDRFLTESQGNKKKADS